MIDLSLSASASIPLIRWASKIWTKWKDKLSEDEKKFLLQIQIQNKLITWDESNGKHELSVLQKFQKKGILEEGFKSPSGTFRNFILTDRGQELYRSLLLRTKSNIVEAIGKAKHIFPQKIASSTQSTTEDVMKVINELEEMGKLKSRNSDNRGVLFWINQ